MGLQINPSKCCLITKDLDPDADAKVTRAFVKYEGVQGMAVASACYDP